MNDCYRRPIEVDCHYPFKVCTCRDRENLWSAEQRRVYDEWVKEQHAAMKPLTGAEYKSMAARMIK